MAIARMPPAAFQDPERLRAANINPVTGLATDYLNHYNEIAMMIATLGDMPEMREPVLEWRPIGYATHFRQTGFRDRDLSSDYTARGVYLRLRYKFDADLWAGSNPDINRSLPR